jgi:hypothetical protein
VTSANARTVANVALVSAGVAAAVVVITTPSLRRLAMRGLHLYLGASVPAYVLGQIREAWVQSGPERNILT